MTSVFSITIQRWMVSTPLPENSSTMVIKMLYQVLKDSRKASKSGAETYAKVTCLCDETRYEAVGVTEQITAGTVHSSVVRAADCSSAGPWFNSGRRSWLNFMTWSSNQIIQMINIMSPITTSIRTITRKSVNMVAELDNETALWTVGSVGQRLEDYSAVIATKPPSECGAEAVVDWMQWFGVPILARDPAAVRMPGRLTGESLNRLRKPTFRLGLQSQEQSQEQHIRLDEDQLTTDTTDLKTTEKTLAKDTAAFEDTTQNYLVCQTKVADLDVHTNKSLSEELEALAKAKAVISEKTGDAEYRDNRSVLSSRGGVAGELIKKRTFDRIDAAHISCCFSDARREGRNRGK